MRVRHLTRFRYDGPVTDSSNEARLCPVSDPLQRCASFQLRIDPAAPIHTFHDFYQNRVDHFELHEAHTGLEIESQALVETRPDRRGGVPTGLTVDALYDPAVAENYFDFIVESRFADHSVAIWRKTMDVIGPHVTDLWQDAVCLGSFVHSSFVYDPDFTHVGTKASEALRDLRGVCQDYAHVMISLCRSVHIPARYVSGYFFNDYTGDENEASHAWVEIFLPHFGWKAFDPTHNREADTRYVKLASGRDYADIKPISGTFRGRGTKQMDVEVQIRVQER